jgi:hypothetical protein
MKLAVIPSPFTQGKFVIILPPRTGTSNLILCESDFESGLPVEWVDLDIANLLVGLISELRLGEYQLLHEETCTYRLNPITI